MPSRGSLKTPLKAILKSIGSSGIPIDCLNGAVVRGVHLYRWDHSINIPGSDQSGLNYELSIRTTPSHATNPRSYRDELARGHRSSLRPVLGTSRKTHGLEAGARRYASTATGEASSRGLNTFENSLSVPFTTGNGTTVEQRDTLGRNVQRVDQSDVLYTNERPEQKAGASFSAPVEDKEKVVVSLRELHEPRSTLISANERSSAQASSTISHLQNVTQAFPINRRYINSARGALRRSLLKQKRRLDLHKSRYPFREMGDWSLILRLLDKATIKGEMHYKKRMDTLRLDPGVHATFMDNAGNAFLEIMQRTGSHIQMMPHGASKASPGFQSISFYGTPSQNAEALKLLPELLQLQSSNNPTKDQRLSDYVLQHDTANVDPGAYRKLSDAAASEQVVLSRRRGLDETDEDLNAEDLANLGESLNDITFVKTRSVWSQNRDISKISTWPPSRPNEWSTAVFTAYVGDLTQNVPKRSIKIKAKPQAGSKPPSNHADHISEELVSLFSNRTLLPLVTPLALDRALIFLIKHNQIAAARKIFADLERETFAFTASNFAILLATAAKAGDGFNFRRTLQVMLSQNIRPTAGVWVAMHRLVFVCSPERADIVVKAMRRKGILGDKATVIELIKTSVAYELSGHLDKGGSFRGFLRLYDSKRVPSYGIRDLQWLKIDVANQILQVLLLRGRTQDAYDALTEYQKRNRPTSLTTATLNTFLSACLRNRDTKAAVLILRAFMSDATNPIVPDAITFKILFSLAWQQRYFNLSRVIWRYACTYGHTDFSMQDRVFRSLLRFASIPALTPDPTTSPLSRNDIWTAWAGKFVIGIADDVQYASPSQGLRDVAAYLENVDRLVADEQQYTESSSMAFAHELVRLSTRQSFAPGTQEARDRWTRLRLLLTTDVEEFMSLKPAVPFPNVLEHALRKDLEWKQRGLGLPKGLDNPDDQGKMFEEMMKEGARVPVRVGNAALARTTRAMR